MYHTLVSSSLVYTSLLYFTPLYGHRTWLLYAQVVSEDGSILQPPQLKIAPWSDEEGVSLADYKTGRIRVLTPDKRVALSLRCLPLPEGVGRLIEDHPGEVRYFSDR